MDFNLNVNVKLDASPTMVGCVNTLATALGGVHPQVLAPQPVTDSPVGFVPPAQTTEEAAQTETKVETKVEAAPAPAPEQTKEITDEQLRAIVGPKSKEHGKEKVFAILDEFGAKRVPDLKQDQRRAFIDKVNAL